MSMRHHTRARPDVVAVAEVIERKWSSIKNPWRGN